MVSRKTFNVIKFAWDAFGIFIIIVVSNTYNLNFWVFMVITVPIM